MVRKDRRGREPKQLGEPRLAMIHQWLPPPPEEGVVEELQTELPDEGGNGIEATTSNGRHGARIAAVPVPADFMESTSVDGVETPAAATAAARAAGAEDGPRRRGRPRRQVRRRQIHFHVDPDEDELLLAAAREHGSQQKGLIAALRALQELGRLRDEVERLKRDSERQHQLLVAARSLLDKP